MYLKPKMNYEEPFAEFEGQKQRDALENGRFARNLLERENFTQANRFMQSRFAIRKGTSIL